LLEFLGASSPATQHENDKVSNLSEMTFNSIISTNSKCNYYDILNMDSPLFSDNNQITLSLLHVNLRSLNPKNFDSLYEFLNHLPHYPDIVCISEMRIRGELSFNISIPNYNFFHVYSATKARGVAMYISSKYKFNLDHKLELNLNGCEDIWINLDINQAKNSLLEQFIDILI